MNKKLLIIPIALVMFFMSAYVVNAQVFPVLSQWMYDNSGNITQSTANAPIKITGLSTGQCLELSSGGILTTTTCGGGGGGSPGGASSTIQYNANGAFGGMSGLTTNGTVATFPVAPIFSSLGAGTANLTSGGAIYNTATTSVSSGTGITFTGTAGALIGGSNLTIKNTGVTSLSATYPLITSGSTGGVTISSAISTSTLINAGLGIATSTSTDGAVQVTSIGTTTDILWADGNRAVTNNTGTIEQPFNTLSGMFAGLPSGYSGYAINVAPTTYVDGAPVTTPTVPMDFQGNEATWVLPSGITIPSCADIWDLTIIGNVNETDNALTCIHQFNNGFIQGAVTLAGNATFNGMATGVTAQINDLLGSLVNIEGSAIYQPIWGAGITNINADQVSVSTSSQYAITSTSTYAAMYVNGATVINTGGGGGINVSNGATSTPNSLSNFNIITTGASLTAGNATTLACIFNTVNPANGQFVFPTGSNWVPCYNENLNVLNNEGIGATTTVGAQLGIAGYSNATNPILLMSTSTAIATTTAIEVTNTGNLQLLNGSNLTLSALGTSAGSLLAVDGSGVVIATTSPVTSAAVISALGFTPFGGTNPLPVANGGTACNTASITCINNLLGTTLTGMTGNTTSNLVFSGGPTLTGVVRATTVAGGVGSGSTLTLESTNGSGTTDSMIFQTASQLTRMTIVSGGNIGFGTTTPTAETVSVAASTTAGTVQTAYAGQVNIIAGLENTTVKLFQDIDQWGHLITSGDAPTVTGGTSSVSGNDRNGTITVTGTALTSVTLTFAHPYPTAPDCTESDNSTALTADITSISSTAITFGFSVGVNSGTLWYICQGHQ